MDVGFLGTKRRIGDELEVRKTIFSFVIGVCTFFGPIGFFFGPITGCGNRCGHNGLRQPLWEAFRFLGRRVEATKLGPSQVITVLAVPKRRMTPPHPSAQKPKNIFSKHVWRVWGVWGDAEKSYESVSVKFELFGHKKSKENHQNHFRVFHTSNSSPILLSCPRSLKSDFLGKYKKTRAGN